jgi:hypothetical protein
MTDDLATQMRKAIDEVRTLRDEAKLKMHLATMDARDAWARLEPKIDAAEREATRASAAALQEIEATAKKLRELVASL